MLHNINISWFQALKRLLSIYFYNLKSAKELVLNIRFFRVFILFLVLLPCLSGALWWVWTFLFPYFVLVDMIKKAKELEKILKEKLGYKNWHQNNWTMKI